MTYQIAHAAARDEADRNMRKHGRTKWSEEDYQVAVDTFNRLWPEGENNPGRKRHTAKWDRCVREVEAQGGAYDPYAVCTAQLGEESYRPNPFNRADAWRYGVEQAEKDIATGHKKGPRELARWYHTHGSATYGRLDEWWDVYRTAYFKTWDQGPEATRAGGRRNPNPVGDVARIAHETGLEQGQKRTRRTKPTNTQIREGIEAAYPGYKRMLQPGYVKKLASEYVRRWKDGVREGKATRKGNGLRRNPDDSGRISELQQELRRLESVAPLFSEGAISATQFNRMSDRQRREYHSNVARRYAVEDELRELKKTPEERARQQKQQRVDKLRGRLAQLNTHINMGKNLGWPTKRSGSRARVTYDNYVAERELVQGELQLLGQNPRRANPYGDMADADRLYQQFHGRGPTQTTEVRTVIKSRQDLAELGELAELDVHLMTDEKVKLKFPLDGRDAIMLCASPDRRQLYFEGGNQTVDLRQLGMSGRDWERDHMCLGVLLVVTYRTEKGFDQFQLTDYFHHLGEVTGQRPVLNYDTINHLLSVSGGQYEVRPEGIVN